MRAQHRDVLIAACRIDAASPFPRPVLSPTDWPAIVDRAAMLGIVGHLHAHLAEDPARGGMSSADWARLQGLYYEQGARNAKLLAVLGEVLAALTARGIDVIALKGAALVETVYGNLAARPMHDVDLLVQPDAASGAAQALEELGFEADEWYGSRDWYLANMHHLVPYRRRQICVEVHHRLLPPEVPLTLPVDALWQRARLATVAGHAVKVLAPDDLALHLAVHLAGPHQFVGGLGGLHDLAEVVRHHASELDWARFDRSAQGVERAAYAALRLARDLVGARIPDHVLAELGEAGGVRALDRVWLTSLGRRLVVRGAADRGVVPTWISIAWVDELLARRSWSARAVGVTRRVLDEWAREGRRRGYGRLALPYGVLVHPWGAIVRRWRVRKSREQDGGADSLVK